jgi:hypothetical protein
MLQFKHQFDLIRAHASVVEVDALSELVIIDVSRWICSDQSYKGVSTYVSRRHNRCPCLVVAIMCIACVS